MSSRKPGVTLLDGNVYVGNVQGAPPRYNPINTQSSTTLHVEDPIHMHLLVSTALDDSCEYEILSQEEADDLKKHSVILTQRITQTRQNLALQEKYRDAATSMAKLYSPGARSRLSLLGRRSSSTNGDSGKEADGERLASARRCEELTMELMNLERRRADVQMKLLQHTAGILQMTHKGPLRIGSVAGSVHQGMPGSPESMYTYNNARSSLDRHIDEDLFDERSLYRTFDSLDWLDSLGLGNDPNSAASLEQAAEIARLREGAEEHMKTISEMEHRLEALNGRLRDVIVKANPSYSQFPLPVVDSDTESGRVMAHLDFLEQSISAVDDEMLIRSRNQRDADIAMEEVVEQLNCDVRELLLPFDAEWPLPPLLTGKSLKDQITFLQSGIGAVEMEFTDRNLETVKNATSQQVQLEQIETVLQGLWDIIQSGEEDIRHRKLQRRQQRNEDGYSDDESDMSDDEEHDGSPEAFSLQAFSGKVQFLFAQATGLKEQKNVLQRQIKQQRELNNTSDTTKDERLTAMEEDLERTQDELRTSEREAEELQVQLQAVMKRLDDARRDSTQRGLEKAKKEGAESAAMQNLQAQLSQHSAEIEQRSLEIEQLQDALQQRHAEHTTTQSQLEASESRIASLTAEIAAASTLQAKLEATEAEMESSKIEMAHLQTEVTIARAELDGAYGSRAQRAANVASNPAIQKSMDELTARNRVLEEKLLASTTGDGTGANATAMAELRRELRETIEEFAELTRAGIEGEKERERLEREVDGLREVREGLEAKLGDERVRWLGVRSPGGEAAGPGGGLGGVNVVAANTSTTVLKNEFKKMMRDTRTEHVKALRAEQAERRRVEDELRVLRKGQGPGKSGLSQSIGGGSVGGG